MPLPPSPTTSPAMTPTPSVASTSTPLATTPTAAPLPALTVSRSDTLECWAKEEEPLCLPSCSAVNPFNKTHGSPSDEARHVGDLGNIETDAQGNAKGTLTDKLVQLIGPNSVIGVSSPRLCNVS